MIATIYARKSTKQDQSKNSQTCQNVLRLDRLRLGGAYVVSSIALGFLVLVSSGCDLLWNGDITKYPVSCTETIENNLCTGTWYTLNPTTYRVFADQQLVVYWTPGIRDTPEKLSNCVVRDIRNWVCKYNDGSAELQMNDGVFSESTNRNMYTKEGFDFHVEFEARTRYVSMWRWWQINLGYRTKDHR
jgi:hypothetical protein